MKRFLCPKCENNIIFDETKYPAGKPIVLVCNECAKQFTIRLKDNTAKKTKPVLDEVTLREEDEGFGSITVLHNFFGYKQTLPLTMGNNIIGRQSKGLDIQVPIITTDPSLGRNHCVINVKRNKQNKLVYTIRDFPSLTGTFLMNDLLGKKEQVEMEDGAIVNVGATTFIVNFAKEETETENSSQS